MINMKYVRLTKGLADKGILIKPEEISDHLNESEKDYYVSTYYYNDEQLKKFKETGSVKGIKDVTTDKLWFDFDSKESPEKAQRDTIEVIKRLKDYGIKEKNIEIYFSGSKGNNVVVTLNRQLTPQQVQSLAINKFGKGLETLDVSLYDATQILRVPGTKHNKSGLYKIPLTESQLKNLNIAEIKSMAKSLDNITESFEWETASPNEEFFNLPKEEPKVVKSETTSFKDIDFSKAPKGWKPYKWALLQGYFDGGERHHALMIIAATCRGLGYDKETAYYLCKSALKKQAAITGKLEFDKTELWTNIIEESVYSDGWEGGQYSPKTDPWLQKYCEKMGFDTDDRDEDKVIQLHNIEDEFVDFVKNIDKNTILTGIPELDKVLPLTIGMNLGIIGAASSGKTALALKILKNTSEAGVVSVFASLDMRRNRLFEKLLYRVSGLSREALYDKIQRNEAGPIFDQVRKEYANVYFYDRSCPTVEDIKKYILAVEDSTGQKVKLVMLDYFERVNADKSDDTAASKEVAGKLQDLVNDLNICLATLVQPAKFALSGGPDTPILNYTSIKGSSYLYQAFRSIISLWRPFFTPELRNDDDYLQMAILKNDLGELDMFNFHWEGKRGEIRTLTEEEEHELQLLLKAKENAKDSKKGEWE